MIRASSLAVTASVLLSAVLPLQAQTTPPKSLGDLTGPWQLFVDDYLISAKNGITRTYHPFEKYAGNPVVKVDQPWEHEVVSGAAVLPDESGKGFRLWYDCWAHKNDPDRGHSLYATSKDGIHWTKPKLGLIPWKVTGSTENNIIGTAGSIMHTPNDPDPARRYKSVSPGKFFFSSSPDGIHWERLSKGEIFKAGDTGHVVWDPFTNKYRGYAKINVNVSGMRRRAIGYSEGTGFEAWPPMRLIMAPDDFDDRWCKPGWIQRTHFYNMPSLSYQTMYLGFLSIYRADDDEGYFHGFIFVELATSRDGFHWLREEGNRPPILECNPKWAWDHGMVFATSLLVVGDKLRLYYSGYDGSHDYLPFHAAIGFAELRKDGFASLDGGDTPGEIVTKRLKGLRGKLHLNCDASTGLLQVEVQDANGRTIPGYGLNDCVEPRTNSTDTIVTWLEHAELPAGNEPLRLRFKLKNVSLYSFMADDSIEVIDDPAPPTMAMLYTFEGDGGRRASDKLTEDGKQDLRFLGTSRIYGTDKNAAFGEQFVTVSSPWRPLNTLQVTGSSNLGTRFTLAVMAKSDDNDLARLFSSYNGNKPVGTSELVFDCDPGGKTIAGLRLIAKGIAVESKPITFADGKYHHLAVTYDDGHVRFYLDGNDVGEAWLPGGAPIAMARDLHVGEDAEMGSDEQFRGNMDDILVLGRVLSDEDMASLGRKGAAVFFKLPEAKGR